MRIATFILAGWIALVVAAAAASDDVHHHHDRKEDHLVARSALQRGEIMPLEKVLAAVRPKLSDEIVGIKFEMHNGLWYYEFRTVDSRGHLHYIHANARTSEIETVEGHP
ncbi:PepSY domain-containing protein [Kordiimonas sp.]|uniref:PepSY domain-containing protein n=1 Tax=Kordiimonas sp. TaxID=1970157 RepID=UPI003A8DC586